MAESSTLANDTLKSVRDEDIVMRLRGSKSGDKQSSCRSFLRPRRISRRPSQTPGCVGLLSANFVIPGDCLQQVRQFLRADDCLMLLDVQSQSATKIGGQIASATSRCDPVAKYLSAYL